jgi:hypothetical protein
VAFDILKEKSAIPVNIASIRITGSFHLSGGSSFFRNPMELFKCNI